MGQFIILALKIWDLQLFLVSNLQCSTIALALLVSTSLVLRFSFYIYLILYFNRKLNWNYMIRKSKHSQNEKKNIWLCIFCSKSIPFLCPRMLFYAFFLCSLVLAHSVLRNIIKKKLSIFIRDKFHLQQILDNISALFVLFSMCQ